MFLYSGFGLSIHSEVELPDLPPGDSEADVVIRFGAVSRIPRKASMDEEIALHNLAGAFHIRQGREIIVDPFPGVDPALLQVLLVGRMMAFLLRQRGWLPLHASAVVIEGQAILFLGASGSGKSTTVAAFHSRGHHVITDDVAAVRVSESGQCLLRPGGSRIRLLDDSRAAFEGAEPRGVLQWDKHLFDLARGDLRDVVQVGGIYLLTYGEGGLCRETIQPLEVVAVLSTNSIVKHGRLNKEALSAHLRDCAAVAGAVPVYRLARPRSLHALPDLVRSIEDSEARTN
jgi:hypothetical protein